MPRIAVDYSKTVIYKIVCNDLTITDIYVGSTTSFSKRKCDHKKSCNNPNNKNYNFKIYQTIRENGNWGNWSMVQIEEYPCANGNEARARERYFYEQLNANLNMRYPIRDHKEWVDANKEHVKEYKKKFYQDNKEILSRQNKDFYEKNKDGLRPKQKEYREKNIDKIREYREKNIDIIHKKAKEYREKNRDEINRKQKEYRAKKKLESAQKLI
jgi:hypothetical protein